VMLPKRAVAVGPPEPAMNLKPWCRCCCSWVCLAVSGRCPAGRCGTFTPGTVLVRGSTLPILPLPYKGITFSSSTLALHTFLTDAVHLQPAVEAWPAEQMPAKRHHWILGEL
jgi:hypothetical protein